MEDKIQMELNNYKEAVRSFIEHEYPEEDKRRVLLADENVEALAIILANDDGDLENIRSRIEVLLLAQGVGTDIIDVFSSDDELKDMEKKGKKTRRDNQPIYTQNKVIAEEAGSLQATNYGACAQLISQKAAIVAYITPNDEHIDIGKSSKTDKETGNVVTSFHLKQVGPGPVKGIAVAVPVNTIREVRKYSGGKVTDPNAVDVVAAQDEDQPYAVEFFSPEFFTETFLSMEAAGSVREAPELWTPTVIKRFMPATREYAVTPYMTLQDVEENIKIDKKSVIAGGNAVVLQVSYRRQGNVCTPFARAKHTLRPKLPAPGNYIPARIYDTITLQDSYDRETADKLNRLYLARFERARFKEQPLLNTVDEKQSVVEISVDPSSNTKSITGSRFFATQANESVLSEPIEHWYNKSANGEPERFIPIGCEIVKREEHRTKNDKISARICYKQIQAEQDAAGTAYVPDFSPGSRFEKIGAACEAMGVTIDVNALIAFLRDSNVLRDPKSGKRGSKRRTPKPMGIQAFGFARTRNSEALKTALDAAAK